MGQSFSSNPSSSTAATIAVRSTRIGSTNVAAAAAAAAGSESSSSSSKLQLPCKRRRDDDEKEETSVDQTSIPLPTMYLNRRCASSAWFTSAFADFVSGSPRRGIPINGSEPRFPQEEIQRFLQQENEKWKAEKPLMFDISTIYEGQSHVLEVVVSYFHSDRYYGRTHDVILKLLAEFEPYFIHQLQTEYKPDRHAGASLLTRLCESNLQVADYSKPRVRKHIHAWIQALAGNTIVKQGTSVLVQFIKYDLQSVLLLVLMNANDNTDLLDSIFDRTDAGESVKEAFSHHSSMSRALVEQMHRDWYHQSRKYIHYILNEYVLSELTDLSLDYIDGGSKPEPDNANKSADV